MREKKISEADTQKAKVIAMKDEGRQLTERKKVPCACSYMTTPHEQVPHPSCADA